MARSYGTILCAIWADPEFCALSSDAQRTYLMLVTQADITACGSLPLTFRRWALTLPESDRDRLAPALVELETQRFVLVDRDTEELLVRSFAKHDGGYKHAQRVKAVTAYAEAIRSHSLRTAVAIELQKLGVSTAIEVPLDSDLIGTEQAVESGRVVVTEVPPLDPQPLTMNRGPAPLASATPRTRCTRQHPPDQNCYHCGQDRLADEAADAELLARKRTAVAENSQVIAELNADLAKPLNKGAFAAARETFKATLESRTTAKLETA